MSRHPVPAWALGAALAPFFLNDRAVASGLLAMHYYDHTRNLTALIAIHYLANAIAFA